MSKQTRATQSAVTGEFFPNEHLLDDMIEARGLLRLSTVPKASDIRSAAAVIKRRIDLGCRTQLELMYQLVRAGTNTGDQRKFWCEIAADTVDEVIRDCRDACK